VDFVLRNGRVIDGTGAPARYVDVAVRDNRIAEIGAISRIAAEEQIELGGLVVTPGFIDAHTHYDAQVLWDPDLAPSPWHGVTSVVSGNCGFGFAPTRPDHRNLIMRILEHVEGMPLHALEAGIPWDFETFPEYLGAVAARPRRINFGCYVGHTPVRLYVMGEESMERHATDAEIDQMSAIVKEAVQAGAIGFATSKAGQHHGAEGRPVPSRLAANEEIFRIAQVALGDQDRGAFMITVGPEFFINECASLAKAIERPVLWGGALTGFDSLANFGAAPPGTALSLVQQSTDLGIYPQIASFPIVVQVTADHPTAMVSYSPVFKDVLAVPLQERKKVYGDISWRQRVRDDIGNRAKILWQRISVEETRQHTALIGRPLGELAAERGMDPLDLFAQLALEDNLETRFRLILANDDEEELSRMLASHQAVVCLSDAGAHYEMMCEAGFGAHLLGYWVRQKKVLSLEEAVWHLTGHIAQVLGIRGRGLIREGYAADLVALDPDIIGVAERTRVWDLPGGADRILAFNHGVQHVWVNGTAIRFDGRDVNLGSVYPGEMLRVA
jgi:N-acyl-D-aspartate/D-glutamate deacylase